VATSGPNQSGAVAEFDDGWNPFSNVANAITFDQVYASVTLDASFDTALSNFLDYTTLGTFTGVGSGDSVTAILVEVAGKRTGTGGSRIANIQLIVGGTVVGNSVGVASSAFGTSESYVSAAGGSVSIASLGTTLTGSQLTSTFGVRVQFDNPSGNDTLEIDACRVTLTYTSGTVYTIDATAGAFSEAGQSADILAARNIDASAGAFIESGQTTDIPVTRDVDASAGTFTLAGQSADVVVNSTGGGRSRLTLLGAT